MSENSLRGFNGGLHPAAAIAKDGSVDLEGSCNLVKADRLRIVDGHAGFEHIEAAFAGNGFAPHRHDTYAIGITLAGVQTFHYRGDMRASMPGNVIVLHPDELHDGAAGTESGLFYRMIYISPQRVADALCGGPLPFVTDPVVRDPAFRQRLGEALMQMEEPGSELAITGIVALAAEGLAAHSDGKRVRICGGVSLAIHDCQQLLAEEFFREVRADELERLTGLDRYTIARQFRRAFGTSPHRYIVMRRLDHAKIMMRKGARLVDAACASGFADQAHFSRHFKSTYGMTPGRWMKLIYANA